eukprot:scaffold3508_cov113-Cylindrotheca_fusiformis.AAC.11
MRETFSIMRESFSIMLEGTDDRPDNRSMISKNSHLAKHSDLRSIGYGASTCSSGGDQSEHNTARPGYNPPTVAKSEERNILRAKCLVALILVLATVTVATSAYILVRDQAQSDFENQVSSGMVLDLTS